MKKVIFALVAASMTMTSCMNEEFPNAISYGQLNVNVSNDLQMNTRASVAVSDSDLSTWTVKANDGTNEISLTTASTKVKAGKYTVSAQSHASEAAALQDNEGWGAAYYEGSAENVVVAAGGTATAKIDCGKAKNGRITTSFNLAEVFTDVSIEVGRELTFNKGNQSKKAYFAPGEVSYTLKYKYNGSEEKSIEGAVTVAAGTEHIISVSSNSNGTITVNITYDDTFANGADQNINFDAATGDEVEE